MPERRKLQYPDIDHLIADVTALRSRGYEQAGSWSLEQICWHLNFVTRRLLDTPPSEAETEQQIAGKPKLEHVLSTGMLPSGIEAPGPSLPPADAPASAVDEFLATLASIKTTPLKPTSHRLFGNITAEQFGRLILIHSAHHLSHLTPRSA